jgi:probable phosphoglycerate mutase
MIHYIRHGQTDANLNHLNAGGEHDIPLNATGMLQAQDFHAANQDFIETLDAIYVSPMLRAQQTADLILGHHKKPIEIIEDLREIKLGQWSTVPYKITGDYFAEQRDPPGGETWPEFHSRTIRALRQAANSHSGKILIVAHGGLWFSYAHQINHPQNHMANCTRQEICRIKLAGL